MSLLDKFLILFETDATEAKEDVEGLNDALDETEDEAKDATMSIGELAAALVAISTIKSAIFDTAFKTDTVGKFSETLGFNIEQVDAWGAAVQRQGGSAESFKGSISALNDQLTDLAIDGGGAAAQTLARLGINATNAEGQLKGVFDLLPEIADAFQNLSKEESFGFGKRLGLDQGTILLLQQGRVAVSDLVEKQRQLGGMTEESYRASAEFNDELDNTGRVFDAVSQEANKTLLPMLSGMLRGLQNLVEWMREHKEFMVGFFAAMATVITVALIPAIKNLGKAIKGHPVTRLAIVVAALGTAFAALYEDVKRYSDGHSSFLGDLIEKHEWLGPIVEDLGKRMVATWDMVNNIIDWFKLLFDDPRSAMDQLGDEADKIFSNIADIIESKFNRVTDSIREFFKELWQDIKDLFDIDSLLEDLPSWLGGSKRDKQDDDSIFDRLPSWLGGKDDSLEQNTMKGVDMAQQYAQNPLNSAASGMILSSSQIQRTTNVSMGGVSIDARGMTPEQAQSVVAGEFENQLAGAVGQLDDGVNR